jgi:prepilin-type N-terminal cleavage/methylation domain-containing protein
MLSSRPASPDRLSCERGFTLIELLVAMVAGVVVIGGLLATLEVSLRQETRISDRVQADRIGRTALSAMLNELHSSCTGFGSTAIQAPSTTPTSPLAATGALNLWFLTAYGSASSGEAAIKAVTEHDVNWTATGTSNTGESLGTLTDYSWTDTGGEPPNFAWTFPATLSTTTANSAHVLATNVIPAEASTIFKYYKYDTTAADSTYGELVQMGSSELPPTTTTAKKIAKVAIAFKQAPEHGDTREGHTTSFSGGVNLRLTPTETPGEASTCA